MRASRACVCEYSPPTLFSFLFCSTTLILSRATTSVAGSGSAVLSTLSQAVVSDTFVQRNLLCCCEYSHVSVSEECVEIDRVSCNTVFLMRQMFIL